MSNLEEALTIRLWELDEKQPVVKKKFSGVSKRNWEEEAKRFKEVHALPLLSRSDMSNTKEKRYEKKKRKRKRGKLFFKL